jgi:hypothetical protein
MFAPFPLTAFASPQDALRRAPSPAAERYEQAASARAYGCQSSLHAFRQYRSLASADRNGRGFIAFATRLPSRSA